MDQVTQYRMGKVKGTNMKQDDEIIEMARKSGLPKEWISDTGVLKWSDLEAFAKLVAAKEREACAKVCDKQQEMVSGEMCCVATNCAEAIRNRGEA
jgi:hypothetical protein